MKYKELAQLSKTELGEKLNELRMQLMKDNAQVAIGTTPKSPGKLRQAKKTVARIIQILENKEKTVSKKEVKKG